MIAVIDACVLAGLFKRNLLLSFAEVGLFRPIWSEKILAETLHASRRIQAGASNVLPREEIEQQFQRMELMHPDACITPPQEDLALRLPDPDDQHVVAAAIASNASIIVTDNIADFPRKVMKPFNIEIYTADEFLAFTALLDIDRALKAFELMRQRFLRPELSQQDLFERMKITGLKKTVRTFSEIKTM